jgi:hypothetical protein
MISEERMIGSIDQISCIVHFGSKHEILIYNYEITYQLISV